MAFKELPKDEYYKIMEAIGVDVCPVKATGLDWLRQKVRSILGSRFCNNSCLSAEEVEQHLQALEDAKNGEFTLLSDLPDD